MRCMYCIADHIMHYSHMFKRIIIVAGVYIYIQSLPPGSLSTVKWKDFNTLLKRIKMTLGEWVE